MQIPANTIAELARLVDAATHDAQSAMDRAERAMTRLKALKEMTDALYVQSLDEQAQAALVRIKARFESNS